MRRLICSESNIITVSITVHICQRTIHRRYESTITKTGTDMPPIKNVTHYNNKMGKNENTWTIQ